MIIDSILDYFRGKAVTVPPMDGALRPNTLLDEARLIDEIEQPDSLLYDGVSILCASGNAIHRVGAGKIVAEFESPITAMALSHSGVLAVGLDSGRIQFGKQTIEGFNCPTALAFDGSDLLVCNGSEDFSPSEWVKDLMHRNATGSVWRLKNDGKDREKLCESLAYPFGIAIDHKSGRIVISESWNHRLVELPLSGGAAKSLLARLPAYPCRIASVPGGSLLALFAPLNRLVEFVLQEDGYRSDMMREIDSHLWIAPSLTASSTFLEPLQNGSVRSMGVHKPWSPTRSYGLVLKLDDAFKPVASFHSRANGRFHGITAVIEVAGRYIAASKGGNAILSVDPQLGTV